MRNREIVTSTSPVTIPKKPENTKRRPPKGDQRFAMPPKTGRVPTTPVQDSCSLWPALVLPRQLLAAVPIGPRPDLQQQVPPTRCLCELSVKLTGNRPQYKLYRKLTLISDRLSSFRANKHLARALLCKGQKPTGKHFRPVLKQELS